MAHYNSSTLLSEAVYAHPELLPVLNRFGITLGVGDLCIGDACRLKGIDTALLLEVVNTYTDPDTHSAPAPAYGLRALGDYIEATARQYEVALLPNIERHFGHLLAHSPGQGSNLPELSRFFAQMRTEMAECIAYDLDCLVPALRAMEQGKGRGAPLPDTGKWSAVEEKTDDLLSFFVRHLRGSCDPNLCVAVVQAVMALGRDVARHNRLRRRLLPPAIASAPQGKTPGDDGR